MFPNPGSALAQVKPDQAQIFFFFPTTDQGSSDLHSSRREAPRTNAQGVSILLFLKNLNYYISKRHVTRKRLGSYIFLIIPPALK